jgi:hypothetical protein
MSFSQHFGVVLHGIVDGCDQQQQQQQQHENDAMPVEGFAAVSIDDDGGISETADAAAAVTSSHSHLPLPSPTHAARNVIALLQSLHDAMSATPDGSTASTNFTASFLFDCISRIKWSSSPSPASASPMMLSNPATCAIVAAAQPLLQVSLRFIFIVITPMPCRCDCCRIFVSKCCALSFSYPAFSRGSTVFPPQPSIFYTNIRHKTKFSRNCRHDDDGAGRSSCRCLASGNQ